MSVGGFVDTSALNPRVTLPAVCATLSGVIAVSVLAGWIFQISLLKSVVPGAVEMKANTALGVLLSSLALFLLNSARFSHASTLARTLAAIVLLLGLATLGEYVFDWNLGIDQLLFRDTANAYNFVRGRMSPYSAVAFGCLGLALGCMPWQALRPFVWIGAGTVACIGAVSLLGYAWQASELTTDQWLPPVALNAAICFILLGGGALVSGVTRANPDSVRMPASAIERRVLAGFVAALLLLFIAGAFTYRAGAELVYSAEVVSRSLQLQLSVRYLYEALANAESSQRGYLITAHPDLRADYLRHAGEVKTYEQKVDQFSGADPVQRGNLAELKVLIDRRLSELARRVTLYEQAGEMAAKEAIVSAPGTDLMRSISDTTQRITATEDQWLGEREAELKRTRLLTIVSLVLTILVAIAILLALFRSIRREMQARTKADHALREANRFLDSVVENIPNMLFVKDAETLRFVRFNRAGEALLGHSRNDLLGKNDYDFFPREQADFFTSKDRDVLEKGTVADIPEEAIRAAQADERILHTKKVPILDEDGRARYLLGISEDITDRKRAEAEVLALNAALAHRAAEVEAVNRELESFSYSVSHDLRAPLRHIDGYVEMLTEATEGQLAQEPRRYLKIISQASRQMAQLIDDLLEFSRTTRADMHTSRVDLAATAREAISSLDIATWGRNIEWHLGDLPAVEGDPAMLRLVYVNLIGNAVKYTAPRNPARIEVGCAGEEESRAVLFVRDNGVGFDMKYAGKLFGVFQRLHRSDEFEGTGIGLATVQRIITRHGGRIWAESTPGHGATFFFTLNQPRRIEGEQA